MQAYLACADGSIQWPEDEKLLGFVVVLGPHVEWTVNIAKDVAAEAEPSTRSQSDNHYGILRAVECVVHQLRGRACKC